MTRRIATMAAVLSLATGNVVAAENKDGFTPRLTVPRLAPLPAEGRSEAQKTMLASRPDYNIYKTLANHVDLYNRWSPLGQFLLNGSSLPPREREIAMLRMGWLCQSEYEWAQHARIAKGAPGMKDAEIHRIAEGPSATGWSPFERALLTMVDELRYDTMISDRTWNALGEKYSDQQKMEVLFTAAQYQLVSMALNSLGIQLDPDLADRLPADIPKPRLAGRPTNPRLTAPRIKPVPEAQWTAEQRELIKPMTQNGPPANLYTTMLSHPKLYGPRRLFGSYLQRESLLPAKTRELIIMRTAWLIRTEYEWAHHVSAAKQAGFSDADVARIAEGPKASGWSEEYAAVLQAVDELRREAFISDATWAKLGKHYDMKQLVEIIYTSGGYTMTGLAINSFGIQLEDGYPRFPR